MTGGMDKYWIIPRMGDKELPRVGHQLASCSLIFLLAIVPPKGAHGLTTEPVEVCGGGGLWSVYTYPTKFL